MNETILFVDDDASIRRVMVRGLHLKGYSVLDAESADKALEIFDTQGADVRLLITDVLMPGMDGKTLARRLIEARPQLSVILVSGDSDHHTIEGISNARVRVLTKPFSLDALATAAAELLVA